VTPKQEPDSFIAKYSPEVAAVNLFFLQGAALPDPHHVLKGSGKLVIKSISATQRPRRPLPHSI
jgi:hypothetical protein